MMDRGTDRNMQSFIQKINLRYISPSWFYYKNVPKMLNKLQERFLHTQKKNYCSFICPKTPSFGGAAEHRAELGLLDFYLWGHLKIRVFNCKWKWRDTSTTHFCRPINVLAATPGLLKGSDIPRSHESMRELFQVEKIWYICWECDSINKKNWNSYETGNFYCKCIVRAVRKILCSESVFYWVPSLNCTPTSLIPGYMFI